MKEFMNMIKTKNPRQPEFLQAVEEVVGALWEFVEENPKYKQAKKMGRMVEPERIIIFRIPWMSDNGTVQINRGYRVEFNSAIGPYKGGAPFSPIGPTFHSQIPWI